VSTVDQDLAVQEAALRAAGCGSIGGQGRRMRSGRLNLAG
jgi:hypothetical protein